MQVWQLTSNSLLCALFFFLLPNKKSIRLIYLPESQNSITESSALFQLQNIWILLVHTVLSVFFFFFTDKLKFNFFLNYVSISDLVTEQEIQVALLCDWPKSTSITRFVYFGAGFSAHGHFHCSTESVGITTDDVQHFQPLKIHNCHDFTSVC